HAPPPARRVRGSSARRHHDARRSLRRGGHQGALPRRRERRGLTRGVGRGGVPDHWTWHGGVVVPGGAVVVDLDGVLSDAAQRQHYLEAPRRDWNAFFEACGDDPVIDEMRVLLELLDRDLQVVLLTARPARVHQLTEAWLRRYGIRWDLLLMRPWGD